jgi:pilus assembly protein CpaC
VSEIDNSLTVKTGGIEVPGLVKRRARTTVELRDGQSFAIAGLLQAQNQRTVEQLPWLGSIPVIGALFRSTQFQQRETELVVVITPNLVKPAKPGAPLTSPLDTTMAANDVDLFLGGQLEVAKPRVQAIRDYIAVNGAALGAHGHIVGGIQ